MLSIIGFILTISILVFVHELGHYLLARTFKITVEEFSVGFGKELIGITDSRGTRWKICLIPLGGYVKIYGYAPYKRNIEQNTTNKNSFSTKSCLQRFCVVLAGPLINYLLAVVIFTGFYAYYGKVTIPTVIGAVIPLSPAEKAGLQRDDHIIRVNDTYIKDFSDLQNVLLINNTKPLSLTVKREQQILKVKVTPTNTPISSQMQKKSQIGIIAKYKPIHTDINIFVCVAEAMNDVVNFSLLTLKAIGQMFFGPKILNDLRGPLTIAKEASNSLEQGQSSYLLFLAMLSLNIGFINLLPIPTLDGGHLIFIIYEAITGKMLKARVQRTLLVFGMWMIVFLTALAIFNDIRNLYKI